MARSNFLRWSFNDQYKVLGNEENFRRFVCETLDDMEREAAGRFVVLSALQVLQIILLAITIWKIW